MQLTKQATIFDVQTKGGIFIPWKYDPAPYTPQAGRVIETCRDDIKVGDIVIMEYLEVLNAMGFKFNRAAQVNDPRYLEDEEGVKVFIKPQYVYYLLRNNELICVNGWNIIETVKNENVTPGGILIPETARKESIIVKVVAGNPDYVEHYMYTRVMKGSKDHLMYLTIGEKKVIRDDYILAYAEYEEEKEEV
jgi:co-chaperonin GroES (HSP10)